MAKLSARGRGEVVRYLDLDKGVTVAVMTDGHTLYRHYYRPTWNDQFKWKATERVPTLDDYLALVSRATRARHRVFRQGMRCDCQPGHDLLAWSKGGRVEPCPCPCPVSYTTYPSRIIVRGSALTAPDMVRVPSFDTIRAWEADGRCETPCQESCMVEPDGECQHGYPSWLKVFKIL